MSDVSESLQVRTNVPDHCMDRLWEIGVNGFVFRGQDGWLTVIPFCGSTSLVLSDQQLTKFAVTLSSPVLNYVVNDFAWGFQLALPDGRTTEFLRIYPTDLYQPPYALTAIAHWRVAMLRMVSGAAVSMFQASQQAVTMAS